VLPVSGLYRIDRQRRTVFPWCSPHHEPPPETREAILSAGGAWVVLRMHPSAVNATLEKLPRRLGDDVPFRVRFSESFGDVTIARIENEK
jgi:hypothetical protein